MEDPEGGLSLLRVRSCRGEVRSGECDARGLYREASGDEQGMGVKRRVSRQHRWMIPTMLCDYMCFTTACEIRCGLRLPFFPTLRFFNGTASCQHHKDISAGNGNGYAVSIYTVRLLIDTTSRQHYNSAEKGRYNSSMAPPLVSTVEKI